MTRDLVKLRLYRLTLIDRRIRLLRQHKSVGAVEKELIFVTMRIIKLEAREEKKMKVAA